ncbi:hypothetical protein M430DRAFT_33687 [Amorphotheca resinae ATCC 22711]|uniref:2EXR domain-containing protein n=1 Tax=Amorphotheca resinae ATCC 22711 TaxID=857342 RepID=A0A2T3B8A3_AMORE|nr:hypothetical protein M430DRAFT_33687 [Amorphotheca resinae ATCC 22711]PSS23100.1 hypothetical protein M430DRAFT_33687 [Amorphotheca resinae ATCC 22711]
MTVRGNVPQYYLVPIQHPANVEDRKRQIKTRLARLENGQKKLKADQRWPTRKSLSLHLYQQLTAVPEIVVHPPTPCPQQRDVETDDNAAEAVWSYSHSHSRSTAVRPAPALLAELLAPSASPRAAFPIAVTQQQQQQRGARADPEPAGTSSTSSSSSSSFIYFPFLPLELRLQIWELALQRPRFIEAQFASQFYAPTFVGPCTRGSPLLAVCRESRECALCEDFAFLTPTQRDFGKKYPSPLFCISGERELTIAGGAVRHSCLSQWWRRSRCPSSQSEIRSSSARWTGRREACSRWRAAWPALRIFSTWHFRCRQTACRSGMSGGCVSACFGI